MHGARVLPIQAQWSEIEKRAQGHTEPGVSTLENKISRKAALVVSRKGKTTGKARPQVAPSRKLKKEGGPKNNKKSLILKL